MKQQITKEQLLELKGEVLYRISEELSYVPLRDIETSDTFEQIKEYIYMDVCSGINIGNIIRWFQTRRIKITLDNCIPASVKVWQKGEDVKEYCEMELCDALWEALKKTF